MAYKTCKGCKYEIIKLRKFSQLSVFGLIYTNNFMIITYKREYVVFI